MPSKVKNKLAILSYHEKRIQLEHEVQQRYENLGEEAQAVIRDTIREFINRSAMSVRIIYAQKYVEELENTLREKMEAFQKLSNIHERSLTEHGDQLDYTWKEGYKTGVQDANATHQTVAEKTVDSKMTLTINKPMENESDKIQQLRLWLSTRESEVDQKALELAETKQKLLDQAKRHQQRVDELKAEIAQKPIPIQATLGSTMNEGVFVRNWRDSKKWISNWCFGLIAFLAVTPIPPEVLALLPENVRYYLIAFTAFCGFLGRYINQTKPVPLPPIDIGDADV
ncbi:DUF7940 domain-containing protein [Acinetobacter bohemicus]|uniref:DUF7940 domain-containing protein n=1 Tax=Acinetobacter bohemicus TaxID=1435036 RepID=UPI00192BC1DC|nr:hypothetical protein [Acinetobacter bohemicus]CAD9194000.1 hypothetical protein QAC21B_00085 [Acinetobacter bohemicus]